MAATQQNTSTKMTVKLSRFGGLGKAMPELLIATLFLNTLALALPLALLQIYDRIIPNSSEGTLFILMLGLLGVIFLEAVLKVARGNVTAWVGARIEHRAGNAVFQRMLKSDLQAFEAVGSGDHLEHMSAIREVKDFYAGQAVSVLLDLPFVVLFLGLVYLIGGHLVLVPATVLLLFVIATAIKGRKLREALNDYSTAKDRRLNFMIEVLKGIHAVKSMALENQMVQRYTRLQETAAKADLRVAQESATAIAIGAFFSQLTMIAVAAYGCTLVIGQEMTVGGLAACTLLSGRALQPLQRAVGVWSRFQAIGQARESVAKAFALPLAPVIDRPVQAEIGGDIKLEDVHFGFEDEKPILNGISLHARMGECIGIAGENSSGKSTLLGLIQGTLQPDQGQVLIDDIPVAFLDPDALKQNGVAYLPQEGELFRGTLMENLTMFRAEREDVARNVAVMLGLDEIIQAMPFGYETPVAEGAADSMPRGIKQRIAIARGLTLQPRIVLFDEANSAIDSAGDNRLRDALEQLKGRVTLILVTPRPSLLNLADRAYNLEAGKLTLREPRKEPLKMQPLKMQPGKPQAPVIKTEPLMVARTEPKPVEREETKTVTRRRAKKLTFGPGGRVEKSDSEPKVDV